MSPRIVSASHAWRAGALALLAAIGALYASADARERYHVTLGRTGDAQRSAFGPGHRPDVASTVNPGAPGQAIGGPQCTSGLAGNVLTQTVVGGAAEAGTGVVIIIVSEGIGAGPGVIFTGHGVDVAPANLRQLISGKFTPTMTYSTIAEAGYPNVAFGVDFGISFSSGLTGLGLEPEAFAVPFRSMAGAVRRGVSPLPSVEATYQRVAVAVFDARAGQAVLGSGLSPGTVPLRLGAGARGVAIHEQVAVEYVQSGGTYLGYGHPITDVAGAAGEQISIRTVDVASKTYQTTVPVGNVHPLTSTLTNKAWKLAQAPTPGPKILHVEFYGAEPTAVQREAILAAIRQASRFGVTIREGYRP